METGCEHMLTEEWAGMVHALMVELCGECTCQKPDVVQELWVERPVLRLIA